MSEAFTKLFSSLLDSTLWVEHAAHVRLTWVAMLAMADKDGFVAASIPGLARRAVVTTAEAEDALRVFLSPDKYSRTPDYEGRRIEAVQGGWVLLNHAKYRAKMTADMNREKRAAEARARRARVGATETTEPSAEPAAAPGSAPVSDSVAPFVSRDVTECHASASASLSASGVDPDPDPGAVAVPVVRGARFAPVDFEPNERHRVRCQELRFKVDDLLRDFKNHEFNREYSDWDRRFSKWIEKEKTNRETEQAKAVARIPGLRAVSPTVELDTTGAATAFRVTDAHREYALAKGLNWHAAAEDYRRGKTCARLDTLEQERDFMNRLRCWFATGTFIADGPLPAPTRKAPKEARA